MTTITKATIKSASTAELLAFYNANSGREEVKRFADRATAEKRVRFLLDRRSRSPRPRRRSPPPTSRSRSRPRR
jgi:hypothetical protein